MGMSFGHVALLLVIVLVIFGAGKLPKVMGDFGKGIRSFKDGLKEGEAEAAGLLEQDKTKDSDKAA